MWVFILPQVSAFQAAGIKANLLKKICIQVSSGLLVSAHAETTFDEYNGGVPHLLLQNVFVL